MHIHCWVSTDCCMWFTKLHINKFLSIHRYFSLVCICVGVHPVQEDHGANYWITFSTHWVEEKLVSDYDCRSHYSVLLLTYTALYNGQACLGLIVVFCVNMPPKRTGGKFGIKPNFRYATSLNAIVLTGWKNFTILASLHVVHNTVSEAGAAICNPC